MIYTFDVKSSRAALVRMGLKKIDLLDRIAKEAGPLIC